MNIAKEKSFNLLLMFTLLLSLIVPSVSSAEIKHQETGKLTIHKFQQEKGAEQGTQTGPTAEVPAGSDALAGVTYEIKQTHSFDGHNWTETSEGFGTEGTTTEDGSVVFNNLPVGRYSVQEIAGPDSVILNDKEFFVDIPMTYNDGKDLSYDVHIYPKNEVVRGDAELTKVDEDGNPLAGAVFGLYKEDGTKIEELTTGADGKIAAEGLEYGKYYFQELSAPEGYTLNTTKVEFIVKKDKDGKDGQTVVEWLTDNHVASGSLVTNYNIPEIEKDVEEQPQLNVDRDEEFTYNLTIKAPGDIDKYKALGVSDTLDNRLEYTGSWTVEGVSEDNVTFKQKGQTLIWEIDPSFLTGGQEVVISFKAKIKPDAELGPEETGIPNTADLHFNNNKGSYTKPADPDNPDPYDPYDPEDPDKPTDTPDPVEPPTPVDPPIVTPTEGGLKVIKVEKGNNANVLQGAEFKLTTDKEGNNVVNATGTTIKVNGEYHEGLLQNLVTGGNGEILIEGLTPGTYYLHETKAPTYIDEDGNEKSYRLLTKPVEVEVENSVEHKDVHVENSKSGWELPTTGGIGTILFTLVGLALMGIALFAYLRRRQTVEQ